MDTCPHCHRKLLSKASVRCNWCGAEINDEGYQQQAAQERAQYRAHEAERDAIESARSAGMASSILPGIARPIGAFGALGNSWQRRRDMEALARAQARAMEEYAATGQGSVNGLPVGQPSPQAPVANAQPQSQPQPAQAEEEAAPSLESDVRSMFRHLEL